MVCFPDDHRLVVATIFGRCRGEVDLDIPAGVSDEGKIMIGEGATPWAAQFVEDMEKLNSFDEGMAVIEKLNGCHFKIFTDSAIALEFSLDFTLLRAVEALTSIPPPGLELASPSSCHPADAGNVSCPLCACEFESSTAARQHLKKVHGLHNAAHQAIVTNMCCICHRIFSSKVLAARHMQGSLGRGFCNITRTYNLSALHDPGTYCCPLPNCDNQYVDLLSL